MDRVGLCRRLPMQGGFDVFFDLSVGNIQPCQGDQVAETDDPLEVSNRLIGSLSLGVPSHLSTQDNRAVPHLRGDCIWDRDVPLERALHRCREVRVIALVIIAKIDGEVLCDGPNPSPRLVASSAAHFSQ